jgi:hypothetical protein
MVAARGSKSKGCRPNAPTGSGAIRNAETLKAEIRKAEIRKAEIRKAENMTNGRDDRI